MPRPQRPGGPSILIGGGGVKRTLPLVARYANIWNAAGLAPEVFRERSAVLDTLLIAAGRQPGDVKRTMMTAQVFAPDKRTLEQRLRRDAPAGSADLPFDELLAAHRANGWYKLIGTSDMIAEQLAACAAAGIEELMLQWFDLDDIDGLRTFAAQILPLA